MWDVFWREGIIYVAIALIALSGVGLFGLAILKVKADISVADSLVSAVENNKRTKRMTCENIGAMWDHRENHAYYRGGSSMVCKIE